MSNAVGVCPTLGTQSHFLSLAPILNRPCGLDGKDSQLLFSVVGKIPHIFFKSFYLAASPHAVGDF